ncbi:TetR/AcrR family transcriptional regulator [Marinobacter sp. AL4B]|nr:TetR/AcrR family transcriptional regulator [Marinobacter sp. AL4B]
MANKVKFERESVVRVASELFWKKGFHATSTRDLQDAVNMRPGSIYSAFGSKEGLYSESLKAYTVLMKTKIEGFVAGSDSVLGGLRAFVESVIVKEKSCSPSAICMLVKANGEFSETESPLRNLSVDLSAEFEVYLTKLFEQAISRRELSSRVSGLEYARFFQVQFTGLRSYFNRPGVDHLAEPMIDRMFALMESL